MKKSKVWQDGILKVTRCRNKVSARQLVTESEDSCLFVERYENSVDAKMSGVFISWLDVRTEVAK